MDGTVVVSLAALFAMVVVFVISRDWARTDRPRAPERGGFVALSVFMSRSIQGRPRCILSVRPDAGVSLRGLGVKLDAAESARRRERHGVDDRVEDPRTHEPLAARPDYSNADPRYDGRAHADTIVDAPRSGTELLADEIERQFLEYGGRSASEVAPAELPPEVPDGPTGDDATLRQLTALVGAWQTVHGSSPDDAWADVFISYPHARMRWVEDQLYTPLQTRRPDLRIFLERQSMQGGVGWMACLAEMVDRCRVFLPVYCAEYFQSDYCQWELQLALIRDPIGCKRIIVPVRLGLVALPPYCALIQAVDATRPDFFDRLDRVLAEVLPRRAPRPAG